MPLRKTALQGCLRYNKEAAAAGLDKKIKIGSAGTFPAAAGEACGSCFSVFFGERNTHNHHICALTGTCARAMIISR